MSAQPAVEAVDGPVSSAALNGGVTGLLEKTPLRFPRALEDLFVGDYRSKSLNMVRISFVLGIALYAAFGVLDVFIAPLTRNITWLIRYAIVCPLMAVSLGASWLPAFKRFMEIDTMVVGLAAGIGIIAMIGFARDADVTRYYYAGLMLVLVYVYTFTKMRFVLATITCWLVVVGYEAVAMGALRMTSTHELFIVFLNNNFFFIAANVMGMIVCFYMERYARQDFLRRLLVIEKQELLQSERNQLFDKNRLMKRELELARRIQQSFIPRTTPNATFSTLYRPMEEVGGDYFDFLATGEDGKVGVFMSDVSGHGVPAALITSMMKSSITQSVALRRDPAKLLRHLNEVLLDQTDENFITVFYGIYDARSRKLVYANAGHNPPYVCHGDRVTELPAPQRHFPIAFLGNEETAERHLSYRNYQVSLPKDARLVFYTDGMIEVASRGPSPARFKDIVKEKIVSLRPLSPRKFVDGLMRELIQFRQGEDFDDDICIICMDVT